MRTISLITLAILCAASPAEAQALVEIGQAYSQTSVNTAVFRSNALATHNGVQYVAYYDADCYLVLGKRTLGSSQWQLERSPYQGHCADAHNIISLMVDGDGYLHLAFDHHGHPLRYCRSLAPASLTLGEKIPMTGADEGNVTYPEFYRMANGDLLFAYRSGSSGRGNLVLNRYHPSSQKWTRLHDILIDGEDLRSAYWQLCVDAHDVIHLAWVWRETPDVASNHDLCYARSSDGGITWRTSSGQPYALPITAANAEYACRIPQRSELINQTGIGADNQGHPYIATYWRDADSRIPQYRLVWHDGKRWQQQQVSQRTTPFSLSGGGTKMIPIARPRIAVADGKVLYIFRDVERGSKVSLATTSNVQGNVWTVSDLTTFSVDAWEPTYDTELWKTQQQLHLFVLRSAQGDGEKTVEREAEMGYVLEMIND
jgi:hypothetical protein